MRGGETSLESLALLCTHHQRLLHEGGFSVVRADDGALIFRRADGRVIPRFGYRVEDFEDGADDRIDTDVGWRGPSREGFGAAPVRTSAEVREPRAIYAVWRQVTNRVHGFHAVS